MTKTSPDETIAEFKKVVNMSPAELEVIYHTYIRLGTSRTLIIVPRPLLLRRMRGIPSGRIMKGMTGVAA